MRKKVNEPVLMMRASEDPDPAPISERRRAILRFLTMWDCSVGADNYVKKDWCEIHGDLQCGGDIESLMWEAERLYEICQDEDWPSQFDQ